MPLIALHDGAPASLCALALVQKNVLRRNTDQSEKSWCVPIISLLFFAFFYLFVWFFCENYSVSCPVNWHDCRWEFRKPDHRITGLFGLENTFEIIEFNHSPSTARSPLAPAPQHHLNTRSVQLLQGLWLHHTKKPPPQNSNSPVPPPKPWRSSKAAVDFSTHNREIAETQNSSHFNNPIA